MKAAVITHSGIEEVAMQEIKELINADAVIKKTALVFDSSEEDIIKVCYKAQSIKRIIHLLVNFKISNKKDEIVSLLRKAVDGIDLSETLKNRKFKIECERNGMHNFTSCDIIEEAGHIIKEKFNADISLKEPEIIVYIYIIDDDCYIGIDYSGFDLSKRDYKIFVHKNSLNGAIAYSLLRFADYTSNDVLLDPFCGGGTIPIEAALYSTNTSHNFFRKDRFIFHNFVDFDLSKFDSPIEFTGKIIGYDNLLRNVKASQKNAKIAGIDKSLKLSKVDIEWLDTKIDKESVDKIITHPPIPSKHSDIKQIEKLYKEFFYQVDFILKKDGIIVAIMQKDELFKKCIDKFKIIEERTVMQGQQELKILKLAKNI